MKLFSHPSVMLLLLGSCSVFGQAKLDRPSDHGANNVAAQPATKPSSNTPAASAADQTPAKETVYRVGNGVSAPRAVYAPDPDFPEITPRNWKKAEKPGTVILSLVVTREGKVRDIKITSSSNRDLEKAAIAAVSQWTFKPGTKDGRPVAIQISVEVDYRLY